MVRVPVEAGELYVTFRVSKKAIILHLTPVSELQSTPDTDSNVLCSVRCIVIIKGLLLSVWNLDSCPVSSAVTMFHHGKKN